MECLVFGRIVGTGKSTELWWPPETGYLTGHPILYIYFFTKPTKLAFHWAVIPSLVIKGGASQSRCRKFKSQH